MFLLGLSSFTYKGTSHLLHLHLFSLVSSTHRCQTDLLVIALPSPCPVQSCPSPQTDADIFIRSRDLWYKIPVNRLAPSPLPYLHSALGPKWTPFCSLHIFTLFFPQPQSFSSLTSFLFFQTHFKSHLFSETLPESPNHIWSPLFQKQLSLGCPFSRSVFLLEPCVLMSVPPSSQTELLKGRQPLTSSSL